MAISLTLTNFKLARYRWQNEENAVKEGDNRKFHDFIGSAIALKNFRPEDWDDYFLRWQCIKLALKSGTIRIEKQADAVEVFVLVNAEASEEKVEEKKEG